MYKKILKDELLYKLSESTDIFIKAYYKIVDFGEIK